MKKTFSQLMGLNMILLGLLMLVPGIAKLIGGAGNVAGFLGSNWLLSWAPLFWAWVLIIAEIGSGLAILFRWKVDKIAYIPVIILGIAVITVQLNWSNLSGTTWTTLILHLVAIVNYLLIAHK